MCSIGLCMVVSFWAALVPFLTASPKTSGVQVDKQACNSTLGIQNGNIPNSHFSASSYIPNFYIGRRHQDMKPEYCRLRNKYAWCTNENQNANPWLMVDLGRITQLTAISTQGFTGVNDYCVRSFRLSYSIDGKLWKYVGKNGTRKVFVGNIHGQDIKTNSFGQIQARYVKIFPVSSCTRICLRMELFGCFKGTSLSTTVTPKTFALPTSAAVTSHRKSTMSIQNTPTASVLSTSTIIATKTTSIETTRSSYVNPTDSSMSPSITATTTGNPISSQPSTTAMSSHSIQPTSISLPKGSPSIAIATVHPSKGDSTSLPTLINALHKRSSSDDDKKTKYIYTGIGIFSALVFFVFLSFLVFLVCRRRKRAYHISSVLVDLPDYPYQSQDNCEPVGFSFVEMESKSTLAEV